jgi:two-component system, response regulator
MDDNRDHEPVAILLVEDDADDAALTLRALAGPRGANRVEWVSDGAAALDFLFASGAYADRVGQPRPRLVLLDLGVPKVDGIAVLERIRADERTRTMPVVALTASSDDADRDRARSFDVNSFITKPLDFTEFRRLIEELGIYWLVGSATRWSDLG